MNRSISSEKDDSRQGARPPRLQVLIATLGPEGMARIASLPHPEMNGVEYIVSWQNPETGTIPEPIAGRSDFHIFPTKSKGLGANRAAALSQATAPYVLISDDDLSYTMEDLVGVIEELDAHPDCAYLTFRYDSPDCQREYPQNEFDMRKKPKGYYVTSFEIALNRRLILDSAGGVSVLTFNPRFGIGAEFCAGEEDILLSDLDRYGFKGRFIPRRVTTHQGPTTGMRRSEDPEYLESKGAVISYIKPRTWPLRMLTHAWRARKNVGFFKYCRYWIKGIKRFRKPDVAENT